MSGIENTIRVIQYALFLTAAVLLALAELWQHADCMLAAVFLMWLGNMVYGLQRPRERIIFTLFTFCVGFFTILRNVISLLSGEDWRGDFALSIHFTTLRLLFFSLAALAAGAAAADRFRFIPRRGLVPASPASEPSLIFRLRVITFALYILSLLCLAATETEKLLFMEGRAYVEYYSQYQSELPSAIISIGAIAKYALCGYLVTFPEKRRAVWVMGSYTLTTIPMFIVGQRNPLISALLFCLSYYVLRDYAAKRDGTPGKRWLGRIEGIIMAVLTPLGMAFMSMYESLRLGAEAPEFHPLASILKLFSSQGATYDVICKGIQYQARLPAGNINYTFGPVINYFKTNFITSFFLPQQPYTQNTVEMALSGNSFSDTISYLDLGGKYLQGAGLGSSYIIETYIDFGLTGLFLYSLISGFVFIAIAKAFRAASPGSYLGLILLLVLYMIPRSVAASGLVLLLYFPMLLLAAAVCTAAHLPLHHEGRLTNS